MKTKKEYLIQRLKLFIKDVIGSLTVECAYLVGKLCDTSDGAAKTAYAE